MIYGLIALALAGSASAVTCPVNTGEIACRNFNTETDFKVTAGTGDVYAISHVNKFNGAILGVTTDPWNREANVAAMATAGNRGCTFVSNSNGGVTTAALPTTAADAHTCTADTPTTPCTDTASGEAKLTNTVTLQHLVNKLDANGAYGLYYQRVTDNPIPGATLKWISSNACKVVMPVQFACTGSDCIEVQNIVCASFAGITTGNKGQVNIECKVPPSFQVSSVVGDADGNMHIAATGWDEDAQACQNGKCTVQMTTSAAIGASQSITGSIVVSAEVQQITGSGAGTWSGQLDTFHTAAYNLTRASADLQTLTMPIGVNFLSADATELTDAEVDNKFAARYAGVDSVPFLSSQRVELGQIVKPQHGYLRIVAKVAATSHWFSKHVVTSIQKSADTTDANDATQGFAAVTGASCSAIAHLDGTNYAKHTAANFPQAFFKCPSVLASINAGDLVRFALQWKLVKTTASSSGKAQLLQAAPEVDPNAQSVEVQVTIQLGGGETNITTGTAEGAASADNTVTYIIIAVCVIAAALILAVVVVAFMCLRNRSQEQLVAMSPKQATVAAVYDISAPKKADVMDV